MMMEVAEGSMQQVAVVYLFGDSEDKQLWYRVDLPQEEKEEEKEEEEEEGEDNENIPLLKVDLVGKVYVFQDGYGGGWTVCGDYIYRTGALYGLLMRPPFVKGLFKHNINDDSDPTSWEMVSSSMNIQRLNPYVATLSNDKICVVSGSEDRAYHHQQCGEIYDIKKDAWELIHVPNYQDIRSYPVFNQVVQDVDNPTKIVFYCLRFGSIMVMDVGNNSKECYYLDGFDLCKGYGPPTAPPPLDCHDVDKLISLCMNAVPVFADYTFFWCIQDKRKQKELILYGYDTKEQTWLRSHSFGEHFPQTNFDTDYETPYNYPILLGGLGDGKFALVLPIEYGKSIMARITASKRVDEKKYPLHVSVDQRHYVCYDHHFMPCFGKAMLKSTGSGSMH